MKSQTTHAITVFIYLSLFSTLPTSATAKSIAYTPAIDQQRALYLKAEQAFSKENAPLADALTNQLRQYPLYPYLRLKQIQRDIRKTRERQIHNFIKTYTATPLAKKAQASYLQYLASTRQWRKFHNNYQRLPLTSSYYSCYHLQAKIKIKLTKGIDKQIEKLWNVGKSQPKTCDPVFSYWEKRGKLTSSIAYQRSWKAINAKNYKIAKYAQKKVTNKTHQQKLNTFWKVKKNVSLIAQKATLANKSPYNADIAAYAIRKLASKQRDLALKTWLRDRQRFDFSAEQRKYLNVYFGNKFAKQTQYDPKALNVLQKIDPNYKYDEVSEWKVRLALIPQNWQLVSKLIKKMPKQLREQNRWIYWLETAKQKLNPKSGVAKYQKIINKRDFYGFMAAEVTGKPFNLNHQKTSISTQVNAKLLKNPAIQRIAQLVKLNQTSLAYQEWRLLKDSLNREQQLAVGYLVNKWGWYIQGIRIAAKLKAWDELDIRFPRSQNKLFSQWGQKRSIGSTWPVAIARQESAYNQYARSSAGARGFMQLMPATAKLTAKKYNVPYKSKRDLFNPDTNIALGTAYLRQMMDKFNNRAHSSAAYNAGPHRADRWLKSRGHLPLDIWIETIPFNETRHYVQNVLTYAVIYDLLDNKETKLFKQNEKAQLTLVRK